MKSTCAVALLFLAVFTECLGAQSERSRQRSGPIRSVPVGADVKRDADFDCPEEFGYYPHPTDCTLYYVCVFGGALLESCTGGLMYSHELQTCDWPRNVGCDGTSAVGGEELERINEREQDRNIDREIERNHERNHERHQERNQQRNPLPPPPPPRRNPPPPPPPPPRAQPNPVVTSRGQPKFNREEYEKQQQLYAEVDDLPPVEEIETDRQQRVYRGQPSTIGQVQKDRDGYGSQVVSSRTINANIIPASIPQSTGKIGSFSFGTQVDERRAATATPAPQTYSEDKNDFVTDSPLDRQLDIATNLIEVNGITEKPLSRKKRQVNVTAISEGSNETKVHNASQRNDGDFEFFEMNSELSEGDGGVDIDDDEHDESSLDDVERGKRQVRYYLHKGYKNPGKAWSNSKPVRFVDFQQFNYNPNVQNTKYKQAFNALNNDNQFVDATRKPYTNDNSVYSTANPFASFQSQQNENYQHNQFKPSLPDPFQRLPHAPMNVATQIITKSPPISALTNNENPFAALTGGFYNNIPSQNVGNNKQIQSNNNDYLTQSQSVLNRPLQLNNQVAVQDSSLLATTVVTGRPLPNPSSPRPKPKYRGNPDENDQIQSQKGQNYQNHNPSESSHHVNHRPAPLDDEYDDEDEDDDEEDEDSSEDNGNDDFKHDFPEPPYEFRNPSNKYANIENPFANPNFDFDAFLAKLRGDTTISVSSPKPNIRYHQHNAVKVINSPVESSTSSKTEIQSSTYKGMSTPRPFTIPTGQDGSPRPTSPDFVSTTEREQSQKFQNLIQQSIKQHQQIYRHHQQQLEQQSQNENVHQPQQSFDANIRQHQPQTHSENVRQQQQQASNENIRQQLQQSYNENIYSRPQQNAGIPVDAIRPKLKPPNFKDDRQLPLTYNFERQVSSTPKPNYEKNKGETQQVYTVTQKPYVYVTGTGTPVILSTPKQQFIVKPDKIISLQPQFVVTGKPYSVSTVKPHHAYAIFKQSTAKPLTTLANEQLSALQHYWNNPTTEFYLQSTPKPSTVNIPKLESLFAQAIRSSTQSPLKQKEQTTSTTTKAPPKRRPIPKPSPEMNDYYYEDDEQYYYEPSVKSKYMPSTEVRPQRPPMAQNYQEYEDFGDSEESPVNNKPLRTPYRRPVKYNSYKPESATKNHNDVSVVTKSPLKDSNKHSNGKIPVLVDYGTPAPNILMRPEISNYQIMHHSPRNRTIHMRKPTNSENGPFTLRPPKYLNKTTLRPYTVRHRLAKPTTVKDMTQTTQADDSKQTRGRMRHHNIVAQMKFTTPRDSQKQETRFTKTKHDDKTNSLEPTESVTPSSYASPRPKMLYNGSQAYTPDQYDPYYAVYDEDGELYKDTDYVQQYNTASLRPVVQQTYRGTPPPAPAPARRPVDTYTPRPSQEDYDDAALIHGQINHHNQYQTPIRHTTRGEGNELGYDNNPSSVKTTLYEATSISTTPSTTSTTSTTQRPTTAPFTEAMTPSRYTPRSSTDEKPIRVPDSSSETPLDGSALPIPSSPSPMINFSSLAKPFEKTDNSYRLQETLTSTERLNSRLPSHVTNSNLNKTPLEVEQSDSKSNNKKVVSLTTGFSIRRNPSNSNNPYTLTVLTRPFDHFNKSYSAYAPGYKTEQENLKHKDINDAREISVESQEDTFINSEEKPIDASMRRKDSSPELVSIEDDVPIRIKPNQNTILKPRIKVVPTPITGTTKYYLKTVIKRPAGFGTNNEEKEESTENIINTDTLIEAGLQNARANSYLSSQLNNTVSSESSKWDQTNESDGHWSNPAVSPYRTRGRNTFVKNEKKSQDYSTSTAATTRFTTTVPKNEIRQYVRTEGRTTSKPAYYSYRVLDEDIPDHTTEVFGDTVKNIIKAFFENFSVTPKPQVIEQYTTTTQKTPEEEVVNIGFQKKQYQYSDEKPVRNNVKRLQIVTESSVNRFVSPSAETITFTERNPEPLKDFSSTTAFPIPAVPITLSNPQTTPLVLKERTVPNEYESLGRGSKFSVFISEKPEISSIKPEIPVENSRKFHKILNDESEPTNYFNKIPYNNVENEVTRLTNVKTIQTVTELNWNRPTDNVVNEIATTTSTTKSTTVKTDTTPTTTKSISFPTRASRVNPAIKLAATNPGGGRRSYQSSSKCSTDNSLQANPKCNEIKYQRPSSTRGRGSAHYSTLSGSEVPQQQTVNRGTPPTRSRPTLKPSTAVVTNPNPIIDIYSHPPSRPAPVYPQPTPDKTAAKCRKDVCLLPDCYCGGKDIPGDLPVESVPQIVLLTFDDSVNDLNKGLYADLFEKGRVNPNGCPISATFYVSHEWTDYSQVQNLYSAGHEMASHTISHSFGEQFSQKKWNREVGGQREILAAYGGVKLEDVRGMRAPFLSVGGNKMFKMLHDSNFTYDSSLPVYENRPPSWPYTLDYKLFHDCMIPPCPTKSYPGVWEVPMVMWQDLNGGRCSMGDACANPPEAEGVYKMLLKNFDRHYTTNRAPFGLFYHAAWFTQAHHKEGFIMFLDFINQMQDVWIVTNWQALQWVRDPTPISRLNNFQPFQCNYQDRPKKCNNPKVCNLWHKSGVRYMRTCQPCPEIYPWTGKTGIKSSRIDNDIED